MRNRFPRSIRYRGFTLIELIVVMLIVALLSGMVLLSVTDHVDAASVARVSDQIHQLDRRIRWEARRDERTITLNVDAARQTIEVDPGYSPTNSTTDTVLRLPSRVRLASARIGRGLAGRSGGAIAINSLGQSASYAIELMSRGGSRIWLVTLGRSGQQLVCRTEDEVDALLRP